MLLRNITYTSQPRSSMKLPLLLYCLSFYITLHFVQFVFLSLSHSRSFSFFVRLVFADRHVVFQFGLLWLYVYVYLREIWLALQSFFSPYIKRLSIVENKASCRTFVERHRYFTLNCCHCHCDCRFRAKFIHLLLASGVVRELP